MSDIYLGAFDGDGDLVVETGSNPHIRQMPLGTHTFRLTAYRYVADTNEEMSTQAAGVFILTVEAGVTPPTRSRTDTHTPTLVGVPVVPDLTGLSVVCSLTGTNLAGATATWNTPSGSLPTGVSRTGYSVTWSGLDDPEGSETETVVVASTSATTNCRAMTTVTWRTSGFGWSIRGPEAAILFTPRGKPTPAIFRLPRG